MENTPEKIKLSICIPTLNRAKFLTENLSNLIRQIDDSIEIVIVDGASVDNTAAVAEEFRSKVKNLVYHRSPRNTGVDRDIAKTIELSRGQYCWLLSDDDLLKQGAVKKILHEIESGYEIYLCNITACDLALKPYKQMYWLSRKIKDEVFNLSRKEEFIRYCNNANSIGALFSFMSSIVLNRQAWNGVGYRYDFQGSAYALAASLFAMARQKCRLKYLVGSLVFWRNDNESFQNAGGLVKRFLLDFDGYLRFADTYFADDQRVKKAFLKVMTREHPWYTVVHVLSLIQDRQLWLEFKSKLVVFGYPPVMVGFCWFLSRNQSLVAAAVRLKRRLVRSGIYLWLNKRPADDQII